MNPLLQLSAVELVAAFRSREASPVEVIAATSDRIAAVDGGLGAFVTVCLERARDEARAWEAGYARQAAVPPLAGVPLGVKDLIDTADVRTTYGSAMFGANVPGEDACAVSRARSAGAIVVGKTQTHEFAWGITSVNPRLGTSRNPWARDRISGGSSGGSAVALASHQVPLALGTDTGGSIRVPASFCGIVGFKPTYGRVSTAGVWPLARTLDHVGAMARTPRDAALLMQAIAGHDPADAATRDIALGDVDAALATGLDGLVVGICPDLHASPLAPAYRSAFDDAIAIAGRSCRRLTEISFAEAAAVASFGPIQRAEALYAHREAGLYPARASEYGDDVRARLGLAERGTVSDYLRAAAQRERLRAAFARVFAEVDLLLMPVSAGSPVPIGEDHVVHLGATISVRDLILPFTTPQDLAGLPACAVRAGFDELGIPIGVQFTGPPWADAAVLGAAHAFYESSPDVQKPWPDE